MRVEFPKAFDTHDHCTNPSVGLGFFRGSHRTLLLLHSEGPTFDFFVGALVAQHPHGANELGRGRAE